MAKNRFRHLNRVKRHDKRGTYYHYYHRKTGARLPDDIDSVEFAESWAAEERRAKEPRRPGHAYGTYSDLLAMFEASDDWKSLSERTRRDYTKVAGWMVSNGAGKAHTSRLTQAYAERILQVAHDTTNHRFGVYVLQFNRRLFNWVCEKSERKRRFGDGNPWRDIRAKKKPKRLAKRESNRPWLPAEIAAVLQRAPLGLARAYVLGASGFDGGTMVALEWQDADESDWSISAARVKTDVSGRSFIPVSLQPLLDCGPRPAKTIVSNVNGRPFKTVGGLQKASSEFLIGLARDGVVGAGLTMHGLRHTIGKALADGGASLAAIQQALRHSTERMALHYSKGADRERALQGAIPGVDDWLSGK